MSDYCRTFLFDKFVYRMEMTHEHSKMSVILSVLSQAELNFFRSVFIAFPVEAITRWLIKVIEQFKGLVCALNKPFCNFIQLKN